MGLRILAFAIGIFFSATTWADSLDINLHPHALRGTYAFYAAKKTVADVGILLLRERYKNDNEALFHAGLNFVFNNLRFGMRGIYATPGNTDLFSLGFGAQGHFSLNRRVGLGGHFYYAPEFTSAMDSKGYHELAARIDFKLTRGAYFYVGYRNLKVRIYSVDNKVELDDDFHIGIKLYF